MFASKAVIALCFGAAFASPHQRRQDGPVDPGTHPDCTWWDTALDKTFDCKYFEEAWLISHADFVSWNPSVKDDCSGIEVGNSYCVEINNGQPGTTTTPPTEPPTSTTTTPPTPTGDPKPSPTQDGLIDTCVRFHLAAAGDTCDKIVDKYKTFSKDEFIQWNPAVTADCSGLWAEYYYCIGIPGTPTDPPPVTTTTTPTGPSPTQTGIIETCTRWHKAVDGDSCSGLVDKYRTFSLEEFLAWNKAVTETCANFWLGYYYCIGVPGTPTTPPTVPTPTTTEPTGPSPTQTGIISTCERWHKAVSGDSCATIVDKYRTFSMNEFLSWNKAVGADCSGLWLGYYYCIGIPGTPTTAPVPTPTGCTTPNLPSPTQPGAICKCKKWHKISSGNTCETIQKQYNITPAKFAEWNVNVSCQALWLNYHVCVGA